MSNTDMSDALVDLNGLFGQYRMALFAYFARRTHNRDDAEDLVQEVFARIAGVPPQDLRNPEAFLFRVASNLLRDRARRNSIKGKIIELLSYDAKMASGQPDPERIVAAKLELNRVLKVLEDLPSKTRTMFILRRFEQMTCADIAALYGITTSAVERHITRAISRLTDAMLSK